MAHFHFIKSPIMLRENTFHFDDFGTVCIALCPEFKMCVHADKEESV